MESNESEVFEEFGVGPALLWQMSEHCSLDLPPLGTSGELWGALQKQSSELHLELHSLLRSLAVVHLEAVRQIVKSRMI